MCEKARAAPRKAFLSFPFLFVFGVARTLFFCRIYAFPLMLTPFKTGAKVEGKGIRMRQAAIRLTQLIPPPRLQKPHFTNSAKSDTKCPAGLVIKFLY